MTPSAGRPEIGTPINIRLGDELLTAIDERAQKLGVSRASMIRTLLTMQIGGDEAPTLGEIAEMLTVLKARGVTIESLLYVAQQKVWWE